MSSPFTILRRYEKSLMVVICGIAMVSFVLAGSINNPQDMPAPLKVLFIAVLLGSIAWVAGLGRGKGAEWGISGLLVGLIIGLATFIFSREGSAVLIDNGNLTSQDLSNLRRQRTLANQFVQLAFQHSFGMGLQNLPPAMQRQFLFGYSFGEEIDARDVVMGELLRRDAKAMGMTVSNQVVLEFINRLTSKDGLMNAVQRAGAQLDPQNRAILGFYVSQMKDKPLTAEAFAKIRQQLRVSETELLDALRNELKSVQAFELLFGRNELPPEAFWEFYQKLNVRQSADVAVVPVADFVNQETKPSDLELQELFDKYRSNSPGYTPDGRPEEGRPGFYQPRRFQVGYLEGNFDQIELTIDPISDADIQKRFEERYLRSVPKAGEKSMDLDGPALPKTPSTDAPKADEKPAEDKPATESPAPEMKAEPKPETKPEPAAPATPEKGTEPAPEVKPETKPETPAPEKSEPTSSIFRMPATQLVAFYPDEAAPADQPAADKPAEAAPAAETPAADKPATEKPAEDKPATDKPATEAPAPADKPADMKAKDPEIPPAPGEDLPPPAPTSDVPVLDDVLKAEIRDQLRRERTQAEIRKRLEAAYAFMGELAFRVQKEATDAEHLTLEQATKQIQDYATEHQLIYTVTPMMSYQELRDSEDYPIGQATATISQRPSVAEALYMTSPHSLYRVGQAEDFQSGSVYVYWKLADKAAYIPQKLDDDKLVREEVVTAWRQLQAEPKAKARAEEIAKQTRESDKPMPEALAEATVTGKEGGLFVTVRSTGDFTWMQKPIVPQTGLQQAVPVTPSAIPGVEKPGPDFYKAVFEEMKPGEVKVIPNADKTAYFVVKILNRYPSNPEELEKMRESFLAAGMQPTYGGMAQREISEYSVDWVSELFEKHQVVFNNTQPIE